VYLTVKKSFLDRFHWLYTWS